MTNPLFLAGVVIVAGFVGTRYWQPRSSLAYFVIQLAGFVTVTGLLLAGGVVPYRPGVVSSERMRLTALARGLDHHVRRRSTYGEFPACLKNKLGLRGAETLQAFELEQIATL